MDAAFPDGARHALRAAYPQAPTRLTHTIADHALLSLDALADLAARMRPETREHNAATDRPLGITYADTPTNGLSVQETIARVGECGSWVLLKYIEQDPAYAALMREVLGQIEDIVKPKTGEMMRFEGFIFISSPRKIGLRPAPPRLYPANDRLKSYGQRALTRVGKVLPSG